MFHSLCLSAIFFYICIFVHLSLSVFIFLSLSLCSLFFHYSTLSQMCPPICLSVCLSVCLSLSLSFVSFTSVFLTRSLVFFLLSRYATLCLTFLSVSHSHFHTLSSLSHTHTSILFSCCLTFTFPYSFLSVSHSHLHTPSSLPHIHTSILFSISLFSCFFLILPFFQSSCVSPEPICLFTFWHIHACPNWFVPVMFTHLDYNKRQTACWKNMLCDIVNDFII